MSDLCFVGPPASGVAWIPYYFKLDDVPPNAYTESRPWAFHYLFDSGNEPEPQDIVSPRHEEADAIVDTQEFRALSRLRSVRVCFDARGRYVDYDERGIEPMAVSGFTPFRLVVKKADPGRKYTSHYSRGRGGIGGGAFSGPEIGPGATSVTFTLTTEFRLGRLAELGMWVFVHNGAPLASMRIEYTIQGDGSIRVRFSGTAVPSQKFFAGSEVAGEYRMLDSSLKDVEQFLLAGGGSRPPRRFYGEWTGRGVACAKDW
jgi:hypothetical protein